MPDTTPPNDVPSNAQTQSASTQSNPSSRYSASNHMFIALEILVAIGLALASIQIAISRNNTQQVNTGNTAVIPLNTSENTESSVSAIGTPETWKTYQNRDYGFEFKYPANVYKLEEVNLVGGNLRIYLLALPYEQTARGVTVLKGRRASQVIEDVTADLPDYSDRWEQEEIVVGGENGIKVIYHPVKGPSPSEMVLIEKGELLYQLDWLEEEIISTFRFLE